MTETPGTVEFSQYVDNAGAQALCWKCQHLSVYSGLHTFTPTASDEVVDQTKTDLLAYYQHIASCGCTPPAINPGKES